MSVLVMCIKGLLFCASLIRCFCTGVPNFSLVLTSIPLYAATMLKGKDPLRMVALLSAVADVDLALLSITLSCVNWLRLAANCDLMRGLG